MARETPSTTPIPCSRPARISYTLKGRMPGHASLKHAIRTMGKPTSCGSRLGSSGATTVRAVVVVTALLAVGVWIGSRIGTARTYRAVSDERERTPRNVVAGQHDDAAASWRGAPDRPPDNGNERRPESASGIAPPSGVPDPPAPRLSPSALKLLAQLEDRTLRMDSKELGEILRGLLPYRAALLADAAALGRLLAVLRDPETPLNHVGRDWLALLGGNENADVAAAAGLRVEEFRLRPPDRAADARAIVRLFVETAGAQRDDAVLGLLGSLGNEPGSALVTMTVDSIEGRVGPAVVSKLAELGREGGPAFRALCRIDNPEAHEAAWNLILQNPMGKRHDLSAYGPRLTVEQARILRDRLQGAEGEAIFLNVLRDAPMSTVESQLPEMRTMIVQALGNPRDRYRYMAGATAAIRYAELNADADLLERIQRELETTSDPTASKALKRAAERLESTLYGH